MMGEGRRARMVRALVPSERARVSARGSGVVGCWGVRAGREGGIDTRVVATRREDTTRVPARRDGTPL